MIKNPANRAAYSEKYDLPALTDIAAMSARYIAKEEEGITVPGASIPNGNFSDFSCNVWGLFNRAIYLGYALGKGCNVEQLEQQILTL